MKDTDVWADFRLDTPDGHGLVRPRFQVELSLEYPSAANVLSFYYAVLDALGESLGFVDTGSGRWRKRTPKTDAYMPTWCAMPVLWPKKVYTLVMQDVDQGIGNAGLHIDYAAREIKPPNPDWFNKIVESNFNPPVYLSRLSAAFPVDHPLVTSLQIIDWIRALLALQDCSFISGTAGYAIDVPINPPLSAQGPVARERAGALLQAHPGLTCYSHMGLGLACLQWDRDYVAAKRAAAPRPFVTRANWLTILNGAQVELLGGRDFLRSRLASSADVKVEQVGAATLVRAGPIPLLGNGTNLSSLANYRAVAQAIKSVTLQKRFFNARLGQHFAEFGLENWFNALDKA